MWKRPEETATNSLTVSLLSLSLSVKLLFLPNNGTPDTLYYWWTATEKCLWRAFLN